MTSVLPLIGRVLLSIMFIMSGLQKLGGAEGTIGYIASAGIPLPQVAYAGTVALELGGGILLLIGLFTRPVAALFALFCIAAGLIFHFQPEDQMQMISLFKNVTIAGGMLFVVAFGPGSISVDARRGAGLGQPKLA
ncbi:MAG TPA: DoxX family protein [Alphaproteobacteria bacterium]|nr:DoxX family protein [Alphaproteobacteria bacterium]